MDKYIKQLLELYSKVILPKFGAIVIEDEESGELMFNEYLNYNDGKLDELIEKESNMELQEAQNTIAKYIRDIQAQIDKGETYDIFGLGSFSKNKDGEVEFSGNIKTGESKSTKSPDTAATPSTKKEETKTEPKKKPEEKKAEKDTSKENKYVAPESKSSDKTSSKNNTEAGTEKESTVKKDVADQKTKKEKEGKAAKNKAKEDAKKEKLKAKEDKKKAKEEAKKAKLKAKEEKKKAKEEAKRAKSKTKAKGDSKATAAVKDSKVKEKTKPQTSDKVEKKKKKLSVTAWIAIIVLILAAGGSIFVGLNYSKVKTFMGWNDFEDKKELAQNDAAPIDKENDNKGNELTEDETPESAEENDTKESDVENNNEQPKEDENVEKEAKPEPIEEKEEEKTPSYSTSSSSGPYHLIAGGFREKSNAEDMVTELNTKGLNAKIIGRINGLHFVSAKSYNSLNAAKQDINNVRTQAPGAWVYKH